MNVRSYNIALLSSLLKLISDNSRLQILSIIKTKEFCVCDLMEQTGLSQSLISHHLKDLKDFGLVSKRITGKWSHYSLTPKGKNIINLVFKIQNEK